MLKKTHFIYYLGWLYDNFRCVLPVSPVLVGFTCLCCYRLLVKMHYRTLFGFSQPVGKLKPEKKVGLG